MLSTSQRRRIARLAARGPFATRCCSEAMTTPATPLPPAPTDAQMDRVASVLAPLERITEPKVYGVERVPGARRTVRRQPYAVWAGRRPVHGDPAVETAGHSSAGPRRTRPLQGPRVAQFARALRNGAGDPREHPRADARRPAHPRLPGRDGRGVPRARSGVSVALEGARGLRAAGDRVWLSGRPFRRGWRRGDVRHRRRPEDSRTGAGVCDHQSACRTAAAADRPRYRADAHPTPGTAVLLVRRANQHRSVRGPCRGRRRGASAPR